MWMLFLSGWCLLSPPRSWAESSSGRAWLAAQSQPHGSYASASDLATPVQASAEALRAFRALGETTLPGLPAARAYLAAEPFHNTEYLARLIIAQTDAGTSVTDLVTALRTHQNADGGFGDLPGYASTALDTAWALEALAAAGTSSAATAGAAVSFLRRQQDGSGGWADGANAPSVYVSALALHALWLHRSAFDVGGMLDQAQAFLLAQRTGPAWRAACETALAVLAILPRLSETALVADSLTALRAAQAADGSWASDVYTTALALRVLTLAVTPVPNPDLGTLHGQVVDGDSGVALGGVTVALTGPVAATLVSSVDGMFQVRGLSAGTYSLVLRLTDYAPLSTSTMVSPGAQIDFGVVSLLRTLSAATTGTVRGVVTVAGTLAPLAGVTVTANGAMAVTGSDGRYLLPQVAPGHLTVVARRTGYVSAFGSADLVAGGVLVFSPGLTPGTEPTGEAAVFGVVMEAATGRPLAGVTVQVSGSTTATAITDGSGMYRLAPVSTGAITLTASLAGYDSVSTSTTVVPNAQIPFSPVLYATGTTPSGQNTGHLTGVVLDASTNAPLAGATVDATFNATTTVVSTAADGRFTVAGITVADVSLRFTLQGYTPSAFGLFVAPLATTDLGQVRLRPQAVTTLLPDLVLTAVDSQGTSTDPHTLAVTGTVRVTLRNQGTSAVPPGIVLLAFADLNQNGAYDHGSDTPLGSATTSAALAVGGEVTLDLAVQGTLPFREAPISVWADSDQTVVESNDTNNVATSAALCQGRPGPVRTLAPVLKWQWTGSTTFPASNQVMTMPLVIDLDGDGFPEVVFATFHQNGEYSSDGVLRAVSGRDGHEIFAVKPPSWTSMRAAGTLAAGVLTPGGHPVILTVHESGSRLLAFAHDGTFLWVSPGIPGYGTYGSVGFGGAALADLDGDGTAEIIVGGAVLNADGTLRWNGVFGQGVSYAGPLSAVADLDGDGHPEVVAGNTAYHADGSLYWHNTSVPDGLVAVGNLDDDPAPEIVLVAQSRVYLLNHDGTLKWGPVALPGGVFGANLGGPPLIADVDGDGQPDIGVAGGLYYTVFNRDGSIKWSTPVQDTSSSVTGSTVFDFHGDGVAEIVYGDERTLRIYRGTDGAVLWETPSPSGTLYELPVIADIDGDGQAEIIKASNNYAFAGSTGIQVYGDAHHAWAAARPIWNQHTYHITNVNVDGTIPRVETPSWSTHNTYRLNAFPDRPSPSMAQADLTAGALTVLDHGTGQPLSLRVRLGNAGLATPTTPVTVAFYQGDPSAGGLRLGSVTIPALASGSFQDVQLDGVTLQTTADVYAVVDPDATIAECHATNNVVATPLTSAAALGQLSVATDTPTYGPHTPVGLTATVTNTGSLAAAYTVQVRVEDSSGVPVVTFAPQPVAALAGGASVVLSQSWNTGTTLTGAYRLVGTLAALDGTGLGEASTAVTISPGLSTLASLRLTVDHPSSHTTGAVTMAALARNLTPTTLLAGTVVAVQVLAPGGQSVFTTTLPVGDLGPDSQREVTTTYRFQALPEGVYTLTAQWRDASATLLATGQTSLTVTENLALALTGSVAVQSPVVQRGTAQRCTETITNHGTRTVLAQPLRHLVVSITSQQAVASRDVTVDLAPGASQTLTSDVETSTLPAGDYACVLQASIAGTWQTVATGVFTVQVPPIRIDATLQVGDRGRVLVLLDPAMASCQDEDQDEDDHHGDTRCDDEDDHRAAHSATTAPPPAAQRALLEALLTQAGWRFTITTTADGFTRAFRSGGYVAYVLLASEVKLAEQVQDELREAVYRDNGLLVADVHDQRNGRLDDPLGITVHGTVPHPERLVLLETPLHAAGEAPLAFPDAVTPVDLAGATAAGYVTRREDHRRAATVVTVFDYGHGRAVYVGIDVLAEATRAGAQSLFASLLGQALTDVQPPGLALRSGAVLPVRLQLTNQGVATPGQATLVLPPATTVVDTTASTGLTARQPDGTWQWSFSLATSATEMLTLWLRLPSTSGALTVTAVLRTGQAPTLSDYATVVLPLQVTPPPTLASVRATLAPLVSRNKAYRQADDALRRAEQQLARDRADKALPELLQATTALSQLTTTEAVAVRLAVDVLLWRVAQQVAGP